MRLLIKKSDETQEPCQLRAACLRGTETEYSRCKLKSTDAGRSRSGATERRLEQSPDHSRTANTSGTSSGTCCLEVEATTGPCKSATASVIQSPRIPVRGEQCSKTYIVVTTVINRLSFSSTFSYCKGACSVLPRSKSSEPSN